MAKKNEIALLKVSFVSSRENTTNSFLYSPWRAKLVFPGLVCNWRRASDDRLNCFDYLPKRSAAVCWPTTLAQPIAYIHSSRAGTISTSANVCTPLRNPLSESLRFWHVVCNQSIRSADRPLLPTRSWRCRNKGLTFIWLRTKLWDERCKLITISRGSLKYNASDWAPNQKAHIIFKEFYSLKIIPIPIFLHYKSNWTNKKLW